ncbi:polysaccharide export outer membrane protein [Mucilaginibacter pineti]|uniref:Polysaccharide export outer membrane protein n=1 Tax=Mucilaginibacter pineti TaxID=1391627 RepID=A0A1G6WAE6_9SPHI|nr:polysaccharide biosynthesis/export family protein [Mucilaginibacter pineti]SDD62036.1 polysaccharide export outer membrane protein [Mucilaginibacter pineti]
MKQYTCKLIVRSALFYYLVTCLFSCAAPKDVVYLRNVPDSGKLESAVLAEYHQPLIQPDDILSITIQTIDPQITLLVNQSASQSVSNGASGGVSPANGYLVNKDGLVEVPLLGKIKVAGLTTYDAAEVIRKTATEYLKSPTVQVRYLNYKITVLGEVNRPGAYITPNEKVSVFDAIGLAGDLTIYGKRENVLIIREIDGKKEFRRVNLTSSNFLQSPDYYLQQNDVLYIEPNKARIALNNTSKIQFTTIAISLLSLVVVLITRIK